ncbi:MAG: ATP-binding protein [Actinomycetota bacterium]|nr:ATP-binding protein [Actinomycetota bacterium]
MARTGLLVIDDLALRPPSPQQAPDPLEIMEDRHATRAMIIASQLPVASWHAAMGDEQTIADAIMDRVLSRAHRIEMGGESLLAGRSAQPATSQANQTTAGTAKANVGDRRRRRR